MDQNAHFLSKIGLKYKRTIASYYPFDLLKTELIILLFPRIPRSSH